MPFQKGNKLAKNGKKFSKDYQPESNGRKLKDVDPEKVFELAKIHCTAEEIASVLGCSKSVIYDRFSEVLRAGHETGQMSLKRKMHEKAESGDTQMLIWLSKQRTGYRDKPQDEATEVNFNVFVNEVPK